MFVFSMSSPKGSAKGESSVFGASKPLGVYGICMLKK